MNLRVSLNRSKERLDWKQFLIDGSSPPFRLDRENRWEGTILFVRENISYKLFSVENPPMGRFLCRS